jgi:hypothetical protein
MTDLSAIKAAEERKRQTILHRDDLRRWLEAQQTLTDLDNARPAEQRRNTPRACKAREAKLLASLQNPVEQ